MARRAGARPARTPSSTRPRGVRTASATRSTCWNVDCVNIGPEDNVRCNDNDMIFIFNGNGGALWWGNGATYKANRSFALWVLGLIEQAIAAFPQWTYQQALPVVFAAIGLDPADPELEWLVECLIWWDIEGP